MVGHEDGNVAFPAVCAHCREALQMITVHFALLKARALFACTACALAYVEPERRAGDRMALPAELA
jgi:hypothetical protein